MQLKITLLLILSLFVVLVKGQNEPFEPYGNPTLRFFGDFRTGLTEADNNRLFEIERAFLGYQFHMSPNWMAEIKVDIGSPENESVYALVKRYAYFRNAYIKYTKGSFGFCFGIVGMTHFNVQESFWGYRYLLKSFADEHKFGKSVDMGFIANYTLTSWLSADFSFVNGEGYSQLQDDNYFEYCLGTTIKWPRDLTARLYVNYGPEDDETKMLYAFFLGYQFSKQFSVGAEYNLMNNFKYLTDRDREGFSFYSTYKIADNWKVFGRYDILQSNIPEGGQAPWNLAADGTSAIGGVEYKINDNLKAAISYRDWYARAANMNNRAYLFVNVEFKL